MPERVFQSADEAAQFIALVKANDPADAYDYVIKADPPGSETFVIEIFAADGRYLGRV
jgi:hypothetical protein